MDWNHRDEVVAQVLAYATAEGLSQHGALQAAVRFGYEAAKAEQA